MDERHNLWGTTAQLKALPRISESVDGKVEARTIADDIGRNRRGKADLIEAYLNLRSPKVDLRLGKQIVAWGRADAINPTDNLTPRDYTILLPFDEDQRSGVPGGKLDYHLDPERTLSLFLNFDFKPSRLPFAPPPGSVFVFDRPSYEARPQAAGAKFSKSGENVDWSVSYFHGPSLLPEAYAVSHPGAVDEIRHRYPTLDVLGGDYAKSVGRFGFRAEAAYFMPREEVRTPGTELKPYFYFVVGADRTFRDNLNVNIQLFGRQVRRFVDPGAITESDAQTLARQNALIFVQRERWSPGITARVSDKWFNETLQAEVFLQTYFKRTNAYIQPMVSYAFSDRFKGTLGFQYYSGGDDTPFGALKRNRNLFLEMRYSFP